MAVNDVHTMFMSLEIPDRALGLKGWRIRVSSPKEIELGKKSRSTFDGIGT